MPSSSQRVIVVGASSGIGAAIAERLATRGDRVVALARRDAELCATASRIRGAAPTAWIETIAHDVLDVASIGPAFDAAVRVLGGLDRIVYAAGVLPPVGAAEFDASKDLNVVAVNFAGAVAWLDRAAAYFQEKGAGQIVGISSIAGERGRRAYPAYCASKAGLTSYLEALRNRLSVKGVSVVTVKPGFVATDMLKAAERTFWVITPQECARIIVAGADARRQSFFVPWRWGVVALVIRSIPSFLFRRLNV